MDFEWSMKMENDTEILPEPRKSDSGTVSFLSINDDKGRTYRCVANNSVGIGTMCSIEITGKIDISKFTTIFNHKIALSIETFISNH